MGFVRKTPPSSGQVIILNNLSVKPYLFTDKLSFLSQLFTVIGSWCEPDSLTPQKTKQQCRLTEVSEAEQPHRPLRIVSLPRIIRLTQISSTSHVSKGCTQMSLTAATRLPPWGLAALGTRGRRLQSRRAWSSRRLLVAGHDHFCQRKSSPHHRQDID